MEWDRVVPKTRAEARKAEENGFLGDGMNEVGQGIGDFNPAVFLHSIRSGFF